MGPLYSRFRSKQYGHAPILGWLPLLLVMLLVIPFACSQGDQSNSGVQHPVAHGSNSSGSGSGEMAAARGSLNRESPNNSLEATSSPSFPPLREYAAMAWDPAAGYVVLFGGSNITNPDTEGGAPNLDDTWAFSKGSWTELFPSTSPPATDFAAMAYDPNMSAVILFGGQIEETQGATPVNTTWDFQYGTWTNVTTSIAPSPRLSPALAEDPLLGGLILFGGSQNYPYAEVPESDTWTFVRGVWSNITATVGLAPPARLLAGMAYDPSESGDVLFGGWTDLGGTHPLNDTWILWQSGWTNVTGPSAPPASGGMSLAFVSESDSLILYGGSTPSLGHDYNETWSFAAGIWTRLTPAEAPPGTFAGTFTDDPVVGYGVLLLGAETPYEPASEQTWAFVQDNWTLAGTNLSLPPGGAGSMAYDPATQEVVYIPSLGTGFAAGSSPTWVYRGGIWTKLPATIAETTLLVFDAADGYLLGYEVDQMQNSTWAFGNNTWTELHPLNYPTPEVSDSISYDAHDGYVLYYEYSKQGGNPATWTWSNGDWTNLNLTVEPSLGHDLEINSMTYDAADGNVLLVQESNVTCGPAGLCLLTWAFENGAWKDLTGESTQTPPLLSYTSIAYDPIDQEVILFGGDNFTSSQMAVNETWGFRAGQWSDLAPGVSPPPRYSAALADDPLTSQVLMYGGDGTVPNGDGGVTYYPVADMWEFSNDSWSELIPSLSATSPKTDVGVPTILTTEASTSSGTPDFSYSGLPGGCVSENSAAISCLPDATGTFHVTVALSYAVGGESSATTTLTVAELPAISGFSASKNPVLPNSTTALSATVAGGTAPFSYVFTNLPPGCATADASAIECTPTRNGTFSVSVEATDRFGRSSSAVLYLVVGVVPGGPSLAADLSWFATPLGEIVLTIIVVAAATVSVVTLRTRRLRREGEEMIDDMRKAVSDGTSPGNRPP